MLWFKLLIGTGFVSRIVVVFNSFPLDSTTLAVVISRMFFDCFLFLNFFVFRLLGFVLVLILTRECVVDTDISVVLVNFLFLLRFVFRFVILVVNGRIKVEIFFSSSSVFKITGIPTTVVLLVSCEMICVFWKTSSALTRQSHG